MTYLPLSTANLPDPVINPAQGASPADHFDIDIYTGTGATHERSNFNFQPDMLWGKSRSNAYNHLLMDSIRGTDKGLFPDVNNAEATNTLWLTSFDNDGFTLGPLANWNGSGSTYVMWGWKANGSGVSNTDGSITSTVSASTTSGFSIVKFIGDNDGVNTSKTIGHGLSKPPEVVIIKQTELNAWYVYHKSLGATQVIYLDQTVAAGTNASVWNNTAPDSDVFTVGWNGGANGDTKTHISYCFHSVEGFSKFGSYVGNGSADGPFVYTGFRVGWLMVKRTDSAGGWYIVDNERSTDNPVEDYVQAQSSNVEATATFRDHLSNGFKIRNTFTNENASGGTYIYMAFAEMPTKFSLAR